MRVLATSALFAAAIAGPVATANDLPLRAIYPKLHGNNDPTFNYAVELLKMALDRSGVAYELRPSDDEMAQERQMHVLAEGKGEITVTHMATSVERERLMMPIRFPIYKGLIGWRLVLVTARNADMLAKVQSIDDLKNFWAGQRYDWPDTTILKANGLMVEAASDYDGLFQMLILGRIDYFPRSAREIWNEQAAHAPDGIVVDTHIALHYPSADYFFVNEKSKALHDAISIGLERALADGSFDAFFRQQIGPQLENAHFERRTIIELANPLLPPGVPLDRKELWFDPRRGH